jgi:hypothetical protein
LLLQSAVIRQFLQQAAPADSSTAAPVRPHQHHTQHDVQRSNGISSEVDEPSDAHSDCWFDTEQDSEVLQLAEGGEIEQQLAALQGAAAGASSDSRLPAHQQQGLHNHHMSTSRRARPTEAAPKRGVAGRVGYMPLSQPIGTGSITVEIGQIAAAAAAFGEASPGSAQQQEVPVQRAMHAAVPGIALDHTARLHHAIDLWAQRLSSSKQPLQQQQQQQQQQPPAAPQPLSAEQVDAFSASDTAQHFAEASTEQLMSWVELLRWSDGQKACLNGTLDIKCSLLEQHFR